MRFFLAVAACFLALVSTTAAGVEESFVFDNSQQKALFQQLSEELRCPKCQNQNIADSDAMIATDLRRKLYQLVKEGKDRQQILAYMKQRYGDFVHYQPPVTPLTIWLWLLPLFFVILSVIWLMLVKKKNDQVQEQDEAQQLAKAEALLKQRDNQSL